MNKYWKGATCPVQEPDEWVEPAENGEHEKFVCRCGGDAFRVYTISGYYSTYVECLSCGSCGPDLGEPASECTVVHSG